MFLVLEGTMAAQQLLLRAAAAGRILIPGLLPAEMQPQQTD